MLSQARPRACRLLRPQVYALSPKHNNQCQSTNGWRWTGQSRVEPVRLAHDQKFRRATGVRTPPPPSILSPSLRELSRIEVTSNVVATPRHLSDMLQTISKLPDSADPVLYFDLQAVDLSRTGDISVIALFIEPKRHVYLIDIHELGEQAFTTTGSGTSLKKILESPETTKVFFDVREDSDALFGLYGIRLQGIEDIQLMENAVRTNFTRYYLHGLMRCMELDAPVEENQREAWIETKEKGLAMFRPREGGTFEHFKERPLRQDCKEYCVHQVKWLPILRSAYQEQISKVESGLNWRVRMAMESRKRVEESQAPIYRTKGVRSPWGHTRPERKRRRSRRKSAEKVDATSKTKGDGTPTIEGESSRPDVATEEHATAQSVTLAASA